MMKQVRVLEMIDKAFLGGGQINLLSLVDFLPEAEFQISVCTAESGPLVDELKKRGIPHFPAALSRKFRLKTRIRLQRIFQRHHFDIIHTHGGVAGFYARTAAGRDRRFRMIHTQHGLHFMHYSNPLLRRLYIQLERYLSRFTDAVIFVSADDYDAAMRNRLCPPAKGHIIKNGIDAGKTAAAAAETGPPAELAGRTSPFIGTVARLHYQKNIPLLLSSAARLREYFPELTLIIVGDGPERSDLEKMCRRRSLQNHVVFLGERRDIPALLKEMEVFVLSSRWEGLPYALLEAGALKKPVAATGVEGIREVIESGRNGVLVPAENPDALAAAIADLLNDKAGAAALGEQLYQDVLKHFSLSQMTEKISSLYKRLAGFN